MTRMHLVRKDRDEEVPLVEVELLNADPSAVVSVRQTLSQLPGGKLVERDGKFYVPDGFVAFACERQGYVKRVIRA